MVKGTKLKPRKEPKQERSISLVDSILTASTRIFGKLNYENATTNRIAEIAGVSIGSLYQYFPGKDSILRALIQKRIDKQLSDVEIIFIETNDQPLGVAIEKLIRLIAEPAFANKNLSRLFYETGSYLGASTVVIEARKRAAEIISTALIKRKNAAAGNNSPSAILILLNSILGAIAAATLDATEQVELEELITNLKKMALSYLTANHLVSV
jgi:AcrR family transcriptional regulator